MLKKVVWFLGHLQGCLMDKLPQLHSEALHSLYDEVDNLKCDEVQAAQGTQIAKTRVRVKLAHIANLCRQARKDIPAISKRRKPMEKYAVDEDKDLKKKEASDGPKDGEGSRCPKCDSELEQHGDVQLCPEHGSEPFEKENEAESPNKE